MTQALKPPAGFGNRPDLHRKQIRDYCVGVEESVAAEFERTWSVLQPSLNGRYSKAGVAGQTPVAGEWTVNNANPFLVTELKVHNLDLDGGNFAVIWSAITPNDLFQHANADLSQFEDYVATDKGVQAAGVWTFPIQNGLTNVGGGMALGTQTWTTAYGRASDRADYVQYTVADASDWNPAPTLVAPGLDQLAQRVGDLEASGSSSSFRYDLVATTTTPAAGQCSRDAATPPTTTNLYFDSVDKDGRDLSSVYALLNTGDTILLDDGAGNIESYNVQNSGTEASGNWTLPVVHNLTIGSAIATGTEIIWRASSVGASDASQLTYTPATGGNWSPVPGIQSDANDQLASRVSTIEGSLPQTAVQTPYTVGTALDWLATITEVKGALDELASRSRNIHVAHAAVKKTNNVSLPGNGDWQKQVMQQVLDDDAGLWNAGSNHFEFSSLTVPPSGWHYEIELKSQAAIQTPEDLGLGFIGLGTSSDDPESVAGFSVTLSSGSSMPDKDKAPVLWTQCGSPRINISDAGLATITVSFWARGRTDDTGKPVVILGTNDSVWMSMNVYLVRDDFQSFV